MTKGSKPREPAQRKLGYQDAKKAVATDGKTLILNFGDGLTLWVTPSGLKTWRCRVMRDGDRTTIDLGHFPTMTVEEARAGRMKIRTASNPVKERRDAKGAEADAEAATFEVVAARWIKVINMKLKWTALHKKAVEGRLQNHVLGARLKGRPGVFGELPVAEIKTTDVQDLITDLYERFPRSAVAVKQDISRVLAYAWANDQVVSNVAEKIKDYLPSRSKDEETPRAFVSTIEDARRVLAAVEARHGDKSPWTVLAHRMMALTGLRKSEVHAARWEEFDLANAVWTVPAARMKKTKVDHKVALAPQAIEVIEAAKRLRTTSEFVFPTMFGRSRYPSKKGHIGRCTVNEAMQRGLRLAGLDEKLMVPHGWRGTFSTIMNELDPASFRVVDAMLSHKAFRASVDEQDAARKSSAERHYNHAKYLSKRHEIAARWADMLLEGAPSALALVGLEDAPASAPATAAKAPASNVVPLRRGRSAA